MANEHVAQVADAKKTNEKTRVTWIARYKVDSVKPNFDLNKWAGRLAYERLQVALKSIHGIGTPFLSNEVKLPISDKLTEAIGVALQDACEKLVEEMSHGRRSAIKSSGCLEI